jgi:hypothetical protein
MDYAWGWWKMTPELTFAGGYNGSLASIGMGIRQGQRRLHFAWLDGRFGR